jgi:hypothetical protein
MNMPPYLDTKVGSATRGERARSAKLAFVKLGYLAALLLKKMNARETNGPIL